MQPSAELPIPGLVAYEQFRQRMRAHYAAVRSLFVERFREFLLDPPPPESAFLHCDNRYEGDGRCWHIWWTGELSRYRFWTFPPTPAPYPVFSWDELATLGVEPNQLSCVINGVYSDVAADAWEEAGGFAVSRPISIDSFLWRSAADGRGWVDQITMWIKEAAAAALPAGPGDARSSRVPPLTCGKMPPVPSDIIAACQDGDRNALLAWADVLEAAGARDEAELLRWLPRFRESIAEGVTVYLGQGAFYVFSEHNTTWWGCGEAEGSLPGEPNEAAVNLGRLLAGWNDYHPALEWLFRDLALWQVSVECCWFANGQQAVRPTYNLDAGDHLVPFGTTMGVTEVQADQESSEEG